eukprot:s2814_g1.t1
MRRQDGPLGLVGTRLPRGLSLSIRPRHLRRAPRPANAQEKLAAGWSTPGSAVRCGRGHPQRGRRGEAEVRGAPGLRPPRKQIVIIVITTTILIIVIIIVIIISIISSISIIISIILATSEKFPVPKQREPNLPVAMPKLPDGTFASGAKWFALRGRPKNHTEEFWAKYDGFGGVALAFQESETGVTALHRAAAFGWPQQAQFLLARDPACVETRTSAGQSATEVAERAVAWCREEGRSNEELQKHQEAQPMASASCALKMVGW